MKKGKTFILLMIMAVVAVMLFTACGSKQETLESYVNDHPDVGTEIDKKLGSGDYDGVTVSFSGNDMIYAFDLSVSGKVTEEGAKSEEVKAQLDQGLAANEAAFKSAANTVLSAAREDGANIDAIRILVKYNYGDYEITSAAFESDPVKEGETVRKSL